jgi:hypothetical protein
MNESDGFNYGPGNTTEDSARTLSNEELTAIIHKQNRQIENLQKLITGATKIEINAKKTKLKTPKDNVTRHGKEYRWRMPQFRMPDGTIVTAEEASTDTKTIDQILAIRGQGILQELI